MKRLNLETYKNEKYKENGLRLKMKKLLAVGLVSVNLLFVESSVVSAAPYQKWTYEEEQYLICLVEGYQKYKTNWNYIAKIFPGLTSGQLRSKYYKVISRERISQHYQEHKEEIIKRTKQNYQEHKEERAKHAKLYYQEHKEKIIQNVKEYKIKNKDKIAKYYKEYKSKKDCQQKLNINEIEKIPHKLWTQEEIQKIDEYIDGYIYQVDSKVELAWKGVLKSFPGIPKTQINEQFQKRIDQKCQKKLEAFNQCIEQNRDEFGKINWDKVKEDNFPYLIYIKLWENYNNPKEDILDVTMERQEGLNMCWAASSQCLLKYIANKLNVQNVNFTQDDFYKYVKKVNNNLKIEQIDKDKPEAADDGSFAICQIIKRSTGIDIFKENKMKYITHSNPGSAVERDVALQTLKEAILDHNAPVMVNTGGHWIVVNGIDFEESTISYKNPYPSDGMQANDQITVSQAEFFNRFQAIAYVWYNL